MLVAAFNELCEMLWGGVPSPPGGLPTVTWKHIVFIFVVGFIRLAYVWPLFPPSLLASLEVPAGGATAPAAATRTANGVTAADVKVELSAGSVFCGAGP